MFDAIFNGWDILALFALPVALWHLIRTAKTKESK